MKNREGFYVGTKDRECTKCGVIYFKKSKTVTFCNTCNSNRVKEETPEVKMWRRAKRRAKERGLPFEIERSDIVIPSACPILGYTLIPKSGKSGGTYNSPSLDKVIPELGYVKGNIQVISQRANAMKADASLEELRMFASWINTL